jgi:hypothetical protein
MSERRVKTDNIVQRKRIKSINNKEITRGGGADTDPTESSLHPITRLFDYISLFIKFRRYNRCERERCLFKLSFDLRRGIQ